MSDADYSRLLLSVDKGSISNGVLKYRGRPYLPTNEIGAEMAARSTRRAKGMAVRLDKTDPQELFVANVQGGWGAFQMTPGAAAELGGLSLDEEEAFASNTARLWARAEHEGRVERVTARGRKRNATAKRTEPVSRVGKRAQHIARESETADVKRKITGRSPALRASNQPPAEQPSQSWSRLEEQERLSNLEAIRRHRKKQ